jgi:hypothetical protein
MQPLHANDNENEIDDESLWLFESKAKAPWRNGTCRGNRRCSSLTSRSQAAGFASLRLWLGPLGRFRLFLVPFAYWSRNIAGLSLPLVVGRREARIHARQQKSFNTVLIGRYFVRLESVHSFCIHTTIVSNSSSTIVHLKKVFRLAFVRPSIILAQERHQSQG